MVLLVAPLVFRAPSGPAAREIATRELRSEWSISKPARALRPSGALHTSGAGCADVCLYVGSKPGQAPPPPINFARNSPATCSNIEFASLELHCFWGVSKNEHDKLRAKFGRRWCRCCPWAPRPSLAGLLVHSTPPSMGVLHYTKPSYGVSPACRALVSCNSPRVVARARDLRRCGRQTADPLSEKR